MKAFILLAVCAVAYAIPLSENQAEPIEDVAVPIPYEMLRNAPAYPSPVWRTFDIKPIDMNGESSVKIVDIVKDILARVNQVPSEIDARELEDVYANEPVDESDNDEGLKIVNFVDSPAEDVSEVKDSIIEDVENILPIADVLTSEKVKIVNTPETAENIYSRNMELEAPDVENELNIVKFVDSPAEISEDKDSVFENVEDVVPIADTLTADDVKFVNTPEIADSEYSQNVVDDLNIVRFVDAPAQDVNNN